MYKKPSQPTTTPNINVSKKTNKINEKPQVLQDKRNETTTNDFKNKDEQLLTLIKEHLQLAGYLRSFETLKQQRPNLKAKVQVGQHQNRNLDAQKNNILSFFDKGNRQQFFKNTAKAWFACDEIGKRLEFDVQVYFLIYNIHPNLKRQASLDHHSANAFKKYLQTKADNLAYTKEDLALFAIPYTPQPQKNPAFAYLFTKDWISKIRTRVNEFLGNYFKNLSMSQQSSGGKKVSALQQLYYNFSNQSASIVNTSREDFKQNCNHTIQMQALKQQNSELRTIIENYHKKFQEFAESSKQNLLQSNQKWFLFSRQIFLTAKRHMKEDKVKLLEKYGSFFSGNVEEMIQANQISLFDKNSYMYEDLSMTPDISKHKIALKKQQSANVNATCQLDYNKIKHLFLQANIREKQIEICTVLKALRDRLNKNFNTAKRKQIIIQYSRGDACGMNQENYIVQKRLIFDGSERIREYYVKLTEALTTTDVIGLQYLSKSKKLIQNLVGLFSSEREESKCFKPVVGILQRLSFSKQPRTQMIHLGIIPMIFKIFKNEGAHLSDFTLQFLTAMMMNLSLKRASKPDFQKHKSELISIVIQHMTSQNNQVRDYINGSIFLLLTSKEIKAEALKQKLDMIVKELLQTRQDDMCSQQYNYILNRLNGQEDDLYKDQQSDDDNQEAEIQEYEEYEDEQYGSLSESSDECIEGQIQIANGEQLLLKNYVLLGPQAMRQQILTRSVLDQTSKRLNNMTTSINRSRRMDNIFVSKANATILQPQLLENILNKKR